MLWSIAYAQAATGKQPTLLESLFPMILIFVVFYFLIILPQRKARKKQQDFLGTLKRGDQVITSSGILGKVEGLTEQYVTLEVAPDVKIKILRTQIVGQPNAAKEATT